MPISSRGEERRWRCGPEAKAGVDTCALRTEAAEEVCLNGNAQRVGYGGGGGRREGEGYRTVPLTIVRWWLCSLAGARSRAAKSHAYIEPWILSLPPPPSPLLPRISPLETLFIFILVRSLFIIRSDGYANEVAETRGGPRRLLRLPEKPSCRF